MMRFRTNERVCFRALVRKALIRGLDVAGSGFGALWVLGRCRISASLDLVSAGSTTGLSSTVSSTSSRHAGGHHELDQRGELNRLVDLKPTCGRAHHELDHRERLGQRVGRRLPTAELGRTGGVHGSTTAIGSRAGVVSTSSTARGGSTNRALPTVSTPDGLDHRLPATDSGSNNGWSQHSQ